MKKNLNLVSSLFLALLCLVSACNNNDDDPSPGGGGNTDCRITELKEGANTTTFAYTNDLLTRATFDSAGTANDNYFTFERNANNQITKAEQFEANNTSTAYITYEYNTDGLVSKANYFVKQGASTNFQNLLSIASEYSNKILTRTVTYFDLTSFGFPATIPFSYTSYTSTAGNVTKTMDYSLDFTWLASLNPSAPPPLTEFMNHMELTGSTEYQYDDKKNPIQPLGFLFQDASTISANNITSKVEKDETGATLTTTTSTYEYTAEGYPSKITATETGGTAEISNLTYDCN